MNVGRIRVLLEALQDGGLVAAAVFLVGALGVEHAEILEAPIGTIGAQVKPVDDERGPILRQLESWHVKATALGDPEAEIFIRRELGIFVRLPELHNVGGAPVAL